MIISLIWRYDFQSILHKLIFKLYTKLQQHQQPKIYSLIFSKYEPGHVKWTLAHKIAAHRSWSVEYPYLFHENVLFLFHKNMTVLGELSCTSILWCKKDLSRAMLLSNSQDHVHACSLINLFGNLDTANSTVKKDFFSTKAYWYFLIFHKNIHFRFSLQTSHHITSSSIQKSGPSCSKHH